LTEAARIVDQPQPGFFRLRLVRGGPWVCARIYIPCPMDPFTGEPTERPRLICAEINGEDVEAHRVWHFGEPITASEFEFLLAESRWAHRYSPADPKANPRKKIDPLNIPRLFV
jgi:hypothetical protein